LLLILSVATVPIAYAILRFKSPSPCSCSLWLARGFLDWAILDLGSGHPGKPARDGSRRRGLVYPYSSSPTAFPALNRVFTFPRRRLSGAQGCDRGGLLVVVRGSQVAFLLVIAFGMAEPRGPCHSLGVWERHAGLCKATVAALKPDAIALDRPRRPPSVP